MQIQLKKPFFWLVEFLGPVHQLVQSQGSARQGLQLELVDRAQQSLERCAFPSSRLRRFAAKHRKSEDDAGAQICLCLMWLLVLALLSHDPGRRLAFHQISTCNVPLFITSTNTAAAIAFFFFPKNCHALEEDMMTMVPVCHNDLKPREREEQILSQFKELGLWLLPLGVVCSKRAVWQSLSSPFHNQEQKEVTDLQNTVVALG